MRGTGHHQHQLATALVGIGGDALEDLCDRARDKGLEGLAELAGQHQLAVCAEGGLQVGQGIQDTMRRLVEDQGTRLGRQLRQPPLALSAPRRQKTLEHEAVAGQSRGAQGRHRGTGTRHRGHRETGIAGGAHQAVSRIGNQRRAGVTDQRHVATAGQRREHRLAAVATAAIVVGNQRHADAEVPQQAAAVTGILGGDQSDRFEYLHGAGYHVAQIADRCCHYIQGAGHHSPLSSRPTAGHHHPDPDACRMQHIPPHAGRH